MTENRVLPQRISGLDKQEVRRVQSNFAFQKGIQQAICLRTEWFGQKPLENDTGVYDET
jgi:hypothetical protein